MALAWRWCPRFPLRIGRRSTSRPRKDFGLRWCFLRARQIACALQLMLDVPANINVVSRDLLDAQGATVHAAQGVIECVVAKHTIRMTVEVLYPAKLRGSCWLPSTSKAPSSGPGTNRCVTNLQRQLSNCKQRHSSSLIASMSIEGRWPAAPPSGDTANFA